MAGAEFAVLGLTKLMAFNRPFTHLTVAHGGGNGNGTLCPQSTPEHEPWVTSTITPFSALQGLKLTGRKSSKNDGALKNPKCYRNVFYHHRHPNCTLGFSTGAFLGWTCQPRNTDVNIMAQTPCFRKHEKCLKKMHVPGFTSWGSAQFWGPCTKLIQKDGHLLSICAYVFTR